MRYLIDTHVILWWLNDSELLNDKLKTAVKNTDNLIFISAASLWEINIRVNIGKLIID